MKELATVIAIIGCFMAMSAHAEEESDYARAGLYLTTGAAISVDTKGAEGAFGFGDTGVGFNARVGYRVRSHFAAEFDIEYIPAIDVSNTEGGSKTGEIQDISLTANFKFPILTGRIQPYALLGGGFMVSSFTDFTTRDLSQNRSGPILRGGGGVDIFLTRNILLNTDVTYILPGGKAGDLDYLSVTIAVGWLFGESPQ